jgi:hypothetical protein
MNNWTKYGQCRHPKEWWGIKLELYMKKIHPDKLKYNPRLTDVMEHHIKFGMRKHYGTLYLSKKAIIEVLHPEWN